METSLRGRCLCGAVQIELTPPTSFCSHCHCESCRRAHSAAFVTWTAVPRGQLRVTSGEDKLTRHESSPGTFRCFCSVCGSSMLTYYTDEHPTFAASADRIYVPVAALEDELDQRPTSHVSYEEKVNWFPFVDALPRYRAKSSDLIEDGEI